MRSSLRDFLSMEDANEENQTVEDALKLDNTDTPNEEGTLLDDINENQDADTNAPADEGTLLDESGEESGEGESEGNADDAAGGDVTDNTAGDENASGENTDTQTDENGEAGAENTDENQEEGEGEATSDDTNNEEGINPEESPSEDDEDGEDKEPTEEEKEEAAEAMEALRNVLVDSLKSGGLSETGVIVAQKSLEHILSSVNLKGTPILPSVEAFSEKSSRRLLATNRAIDNLDYYIAKLKG